MYNDVDLWNDLGYVDSNNIPTDEMDNSSFVDSSGHFASGLNLGPLIKMGGTFLGAYGDILAGNQRNEASQYNAQLALQQEGFAIDKLDKAEVSILSTQKAMYSKAGVAMTGSPLDVALKTATNFEMDKQITKYNAQSRANMYQYEGALAQSQGQIKAGMDLLSGGAAMGATLFL